MFSKTTHQVDFVNLNGLDEGTKTQSWATKKLPAHAFLFIAIEIASKIRQLAIFYIPSRNSDSRSNLSQVRIYSPMCVLVQKVAKYRICDNYIEYATMLTTFCEACCDALLESEPIFTKSIDTRVKAP